MVNMLRCRPAGGWATAVAVYLGAAWPLGAQAPAHFRHPGLAPPGAIGSAELERGGPRPGYFQPVEITAPPGTLISLAVEGAFAEPQPAPVTAGMLIAPVYRLRVANIPQRDGEEVFPTIEVINRVYPPAGQAWRFPIPIDLAQEDLWLALEGKFVTRVVYLEDPDRALPVAEGPVARRWYDAGPGVDPLEEADRRGRPVAILRMGGRLPDDRQGPDLEFLRGSPPFTLFRPLERAER